ncbi:Uma2 family endonuclease [Baaleninema simplex]|uniref:Uma2 family endonuclease n=1 Tax=Baaleninema simplex TaxID=2862350 RepID=UPI0003498A92|nr:Uma2 family endonuclease [Baaleninema simplex]
MAQVKVLNPIKVRLLTVEDYHRMAEAGILHPDERVELLDGEILQMSPIGRRHAAYVLRIANQLKDELGSRTFIDVQNPVVLNDYSEPQPDIVLLPPREDFYIETGVSASDVYLVVEVSDSTLEFDRTEKLPRYALAEIPEVWIVDTNANQLEVYRNPVEGKYQTSQILSRGDRISILAFPNREIELNTLLFEE